MASDFLMPSLVAYTFGLITKKLLPKAKSQRCMLIVSSEFCDFSLFHLGLCFILSWFFILYKVWVLVHCFPSGYPVVLSLFVGKLFFSYWTVLAHLLKISSPSTYGLFHWSICRSLTSTTLLITVVLWWVLK